jgi:large subunit ribosomal protein L1
VFRLLPPEKVEEAKAAGADYAGLEEFIQKVSDGWMDIDVIIATPERDGSAG